MGKRKSTSQDQAIKNEPKISKNEPTTTADAQDSVIGNVEIKTEKKQKMDKKTTVEEEQGLY